MLLRRTSRSSTINWRNYIILIRTLKQLTNLKRSQMHTASLETPNWEQTTIKPVFIRIIQTSPIRIKISEPPRTRISEISPAFTPNILKQEQTTNKRVKISTGSSDKISKGNLGKTKTGLSTISNRTIKASFKKTFLMNFSSQRKNNTSTDISMAEARKTRDKNSLKIFWDRNKKLRGSTMRAWKSSMSSGPLNRKRERILTIGFKTKSTIRSVLWISWGVSFSSAVGIWSPCWLGSFSLEDLQSGKLLKKNTCEPFRCNVMQRECKWMQEVLEILLPVTFTICL